MRLAELDASLSDPQVMGDIGRWRRLSREQADVAAVVALWRRHGQREADIATAREMAADPEFAEMAAAEIVQAEAELLQLQAQLRLALVPRDPDDERNAFLEVRAGTGGDESALFAGDLVRLYSRWCERQGWRLEVMSESPAELGGYKELVLRVEGEEIGRAHV